MLPIEHQIHTLHRLSQTLKTQHHRGLVVLQGEIDWQQNLWQALCQTHSADQCLQIGGNAHPELYRTIPLSQTRHLLGQEAQHAFLSAYHTDAGIDLDALGIISGLLTPGGLCLIGLPPEPTWSHFPNPAAFKYLNTPYTAKDLKHGFNAFLSQTLQKNALIRLSPNHSPNLTDFCLPKKQKMPESPVLLAQKTDLQPNNEQQQAIAHILRVATGHRRRPLLLTADRGRGKSAALGLAIADLFQLGKRHIGLTAARKAQAQIVLNTLQKALNQHHIPFQIQGQTLTAQLPNGDATLQFYAPDALQQSPPKLDLLMVEEAAHLPLPLLEKLLQQFPRLVFATTLHGYEGSGRGFSLKFNTLLQQHTDGWQQHTLHTPIRWADNDPLEHTVQQLYLQTPPSPLLISDEITEETPHTLWQTPDKLSAIFQLLIDAHYQTRPNDLLQLLEAPNLKLWCRWQDQQLVGVLLAIEEGGLPDTLPLNKRLHGHLVPQQLYQQTLNPQWLTLKSWRIMRLAITPSQQNQGLGTQLVQHALQQAQACALDFVSTSFGATSELIHFWQRRHFTPLYLGLKQDKASASHALTLVHPLTPHAQKLTQTQLKTYRLQFADLLGRNFQNLNPDLVLTLLAALRYPRQKLPLGYRDGQPFEALSAHLKQWALSHPDTLQHWPTSSRHAFIQLVCQHHLWHNLSTHASRPTLEKNWKKHLFGT